MPDVSSSDAGGPPTSRCDRATLADGGSRAARRSRPLVATALPATAPGVALFAALTSLPSSLILLQPDARAWRTEPVVPAGTPGVLAVLQCGPELSLGTARRCIADTLPPWSWPRALSRPSAPATPQREGGPPGLHRPRRWCVGAVSASDPSSTRSGRSWSGWPGRAGPRADSGPDIPLSGAGFWLDSVDLLEVVVACESEFGITFDATTDLTSETLATLGSLSALIRAKQSPVRADR